MGREIWNDGKATEIFDIFRPNGIEVDILQDWMESWVDVIDMSTEIAGNARLAFFMGGNSDVLSFVKEDAFEAFRLSSWMSVPFNNAFPVSHILTDKTFYSFYISKYRNS